MPNLNGALEDIYRTYRQQLYTCALAVTRCPVRAEDAIQEAFSRLLRLTRKPDDLKVYTFRAVRNAAIDQVSRQRRPSNAVESNDGTTIFESRDGPQEVASKKEFRARVENALETLPEHEREAVVLHLYGDLTFKEIARARGDRRGTVAAWYYKGIKRLRGLLKE